MLNKHNEEIQRRIQKRIDNSERKKERTKARHILLKSLEKKHGVSWRRVVQIDKDGLIVNEWETADQAGKELKFSIRKCLIGEADEINGMRFTYLVLHLEEHGK